MQRTARPANFYDTATNGHKVQLLRKSVQSKGAGKLLKVMAGDKLDIKVDYYIPTATTNNNTANGLNTIINALASVIDNSTVTTTLHGNGNTITSDLDNNNSFTDFLAPQTGSAGTTLPKAYLNIVFFDEQFKFVNENSEAVQVSTDGSGQTIYRLGGSAKTATKNGYVYIYVSNESDNLVYFDNLQITHEHGPLLQEDHYYPYGLGMAGISSSAVSGIIANKYKANGGTEIGSSEWADGSGLELYETTFRSYDAQIGRFMQVDPEMESTANLGGYVFGGDNPATFVDPTGLRMNYNIPAPPNFGTGDHPDPDGLFDDGGGGAGGGGGFFSHMDGNGNKWHHTDVLAGTASAAQPYIAGNGVDGFGHDTYAWNPGETRIEQFANAQKYFDKIKRLIAQHYQISVSGVYTSKMGNHYAGLTFTREKDGYDVYSWNLKLVTSYVYQNSGVFEPQSENYREGNNSIEFFFEFNEQVVDRTISTGDALNRAINGAYPTVKKALPEMIENVGRLSEGVAAGGKFYSSYHEAFVDQAPNYTNAAADFVEGVGTVALAFLCPEAVLFWGIGCYINDTFIRK